MPRLLSLNNPKLTNQKREQYLNICRHVFALVFSHHYTNLILTQVAKIKDANTPATAEKIKRSLKEGFGDMLVKHLGIQDNLSNISTLKKRKMQSTLYRLYHGAGFDDEVAFLRGRSLLTGNSSKTSPEAKLKESDMLEIESYQEVLAEEKRTVKEVNILVLTDSIQQVHGFVAYHVFRQNNQTIVHARQAAMLTPGRGYAGHIADFFADNYPKAKYEANRRVGNPVLMNEHLLECKMATKGEAVLGYSEFYNSIISKENLFPTVVSWREKIETQATHSQSDDNLPHRLFRPLSLQKSGFSDDMALLEMQRNYRAPNL